jgi:hypothetical protein
MKKITAVKVFENYRVWLRFNDGVEGEADFPRKPRTVFLLFGTITKMFARRASAIAASCFGTISLIFVPIRSGCK